VQKIFGSFIALLLVHFVNTVSAQIRGQAYDFGCVGDPAGRTTGSINGYIVTEGRWITYAANCDSTKNGGVPTVTYPVVMPTDGPIQAVVLVVKSEFTPAGQKAVRKVCSVQATSGYVEGRCFVNPSKYNASVHYFLSIND